MKLKEITSTYKRMSKRTFFFTYMSVFTVCIILGFISQLELNLPGFTINSLLSVVSLFDLFLVELSILLIIGGWMLDRNVFGRVVLYIISSFYITTYFVQFTSFYQGREFLSRLAIDNMNHVGLLINPQTITGILFLLSVCLVLPLLIEKKPYQAYRTPGKLIVVTFCLIVAAVGLQQSNRWFPQSILKQRDIFFEDNYLPHAAPLSALYNTLFSKGSLYSDELGPADFSPFELNEIKKFGFQYTPDSKYPLLREGIYSTPPPFKSLPGSPAAPNIIVFFTEGFSARAMNTYGSQYENITPNLDTFAKTSMVVDNYYNHTAATYRGLHGQLCSVFPTYGGVGGWQTNYKNLPETNYYCLSNVFNKRGYETIFLDAHRKHASQVDEMMVQLGFKKVVTGRVLSKKYLKNAKPQMKYALSDEQFFRGLIGVLKEREKNNKVDAPFFMGLYNLGTHAFKKMTNDGKKFGEGDNNSLNTIHNLDNAFGLFWEYYKTSPFAENTIVIFTADHCHYPEKPFVEAFDGPGYQAVFVDKIPLIIHDPTRELPKTFDASNATSIDFAPSLIHYLNLGNHKNPFMGTSIYEKKRKKYDNFGLNSYGKDLYLIDDEKIHKLGFSHKHRVKLQILKKYVNKSKQLEVTDQLWDKNLNSEL